MLTGTREKLTQADGRIRELREEKHRATKLRETAVAAYSANGDDASFKAAKQAKESVDAVQAKLDAIQDEQTALLKTLGDAEQQGRVSLTLPGDNGYAKAAAGLDLANGNLRVDVRANSLLRAQAAPLPSSPSDGGFSLVSGPEQSRRYLYPVLARDAFGDGSGREAAATDFTVSFAQGELTGVERAPDATTGKATLNTTTSLATVEARQHAVVAEGIPSKLFDHQAALRSFLGVELARRVDESVDSHLVAKIEAANPPSGSTGASLVPKIRNAIAAMRGLGGNPTYLAVTPSDAAALDLSVQPGAVIGSSASISKGLVASSGASWFAKFRRSRPRP